MTSVKPDAGLVTGGETITLTGANYEKDEVQEVLFEVETEAGTESVPAESFEVVSETVKAVAPEIAWEEEGGAVVFAEPFAKIRHQRRAKIRVVTAVGSSATRLDNSFTYVEAAAPPTVRKLSPNKGTADAGVRVTITGTGLSGATAVLFGDQAGTEVDVVSETSLTVLAPTSGEGTVNVTVSTPSGKSSESSKDHFKYGKPATPTVTRIDPASGPPAGGSEIVVSGTNFAAGATFTFGKAKVGGTDCISTSCSVETPAGKAGTVDVIATVGKSKSKKNRPVDEFTYD